jgi:AraC-like DNA-binding protein
MTSFDPLRPDFASYGFSCVRWHPSVMSRPDRHNEIEINLLHTGSLTYLVGGHKVQIPAKRLSAFWAAMPHQIIEYEDSSEYFVATLPLAWFLQCRLPEPLVQSLLQGHVVVESAAELVQSDFQLLAHWEQDLGHPTGNLRRAVLLELEARLLRLACTMPPAEKRTVNRHRQSVSDTDLSKVEQMASYIARNYTHPLSVDVISKHVDLHPNYAMGLFKDKIGTTLIDYITKQRISHAQRLLATTDIRILDIALASGFVSISRFNEAFKRECGSPPRLYRKQHQDMDDSETG